MQVTEVHHGEAVGAVADHRQSSATNKYDSRSVAARLFEQVDDAGGIDTSSAEQARRGRQALVPAPARA